MRGISAGKFKLKLQQWRATAKETTDLAVIVSKFLCFLHITENYICSTTLVHGVSMLPTLNVRGDVLLSERISQRLGRVGVGDVVLVKAPDNPRKTITKRIVALEGDRVSLFGDPFRDDFSSTYVVPKGHVWVQGDNIYASKDSRHFGPVPYGLIKGRAFFRVWPPDAVGPLGRPQ